MADATKISLGGGNIGAQQSGGTVAVDQLSIVGTGSALTSPNGAHVSLRHSGALNALGTRCQIPFTNATYFPVHHGCLPGQVLYVPSAGGIERALATDIAAATAVAMSGPGGYDPIDVIGTAYATPPQSGQITLTAAEWAAVIDGGGPLLPGTPYYLSQATAGNITSTKPESGYVTSVGIAIGPLDFLLRIDLPVLVG